MAEQAVADAHARAAAAHESVPYENASAHESAHHGAGALHHHFEDMDQQREATSLGMWSFLTTEVMMFGALFFVYSLYRWKFTTAAHVAGQVDPFYAGSHMLNTPMGMANTLVLLVSSLTMAMGVHYAQQNNKKKLVTMMSLTWILGLTFLVVKGFEWHADYNEGLVPFFNAWSPAEALYHKHFALDAVNLNHLQMFFNIYFLMTGLHGIHMIIGLAVVGWMIHLARIGHFANGNDQPIEIVGLYWHFVDIVWVFLFPMMYLIAGHHHL